MSIIGEEVTVIGDDAASLREVEDDDSPRDPEDSVHHKETFANLKFKDFTKRFESIQNEKEKNYAFYF